MSHARKAKKAKTLRRESIAYAKRVCSDIKRLLKDKDPDAGDKIKKLAPTLAKYGLSVRISNSGRHLIKRGF